MFCVFMVVVNDCEKSTLNANLYAADNKIEITGRMPTRLVDIFNYCGQGSWEHSAQYRNTTGRELVAQEHCHTGLQEGQVTVRDSKTN